MKKLLLIVLLAIASIAHGQTIIDKTDDFTGKKIKTAVVVFGKTIAPQPITLSFGVNEGNKYIAFTWSANAGAFGAFNNIKPENISLLFKMDDDVILKFKADTSLTKILNSGISSMMVVSSSISDDQLMEFARHKVAKFRVGVREDNGVDMDGNYMYTDRNKNQTQKAAAYMLDMQIIAEDTDK